MSLGAVFRMTRVSFNKLLDLIKDQISPDEKQAKNSSGSAISAATKLGATIRFLAGGSYIDIAGLYGLDPNNFFNSVSGPLWPTIRALDSVLHIGLDLDPAALKKTGLAFSKFTNGRMVHNVMAVDGWVVRTRMPTKAEVGNS